MSERVFEGLDGQVRERTKTMLMYFIVFAVTMLFAGFTSAYIVSNMGQFWVHIPAPSMFWVSNVLPIYYHAIVSFHLFVKSMINSINHNYTI